MPADILLETEISGLWTPVRGCDLSTGVETVGPWRSRCACVERLVRTWNPRPEVTETNVESTVYPSVATSPGSTLQRMRDP